MFKWWKSKTRQQRSRFIEECVENTVMFGLPCAAFVLLALGTLLGWDVWRR